MTWEELKDKAKELGYKQTMKVLIEKQVECLLNKECFAFYENGICEYDCENDSPWSGIPFAYYRTPDQMYAIMEALK